MTRLLRVRGHSQMTSAEKGRGVWPNSDQRKGDFMNLVLTGRGVQNPKYLIDVYQEQVTIHQTTYKHYYRAQPFMNLVSM